MKIIGQPAMTKISELDPGDLFILTHEAGLTVAFLALDPSENEKLAVALAPPFPPGPPGPGFTRADSVVLSFGKDFALRLPSAPGGWQVEAPAPDVTCFVVAGGDVFLRANFGEPEHVQHCYVDVRTGIISTDRENRVFIPPKGSRAFALQWELLTNDDDPRVIVGGGSGPG